ncbi:unnamed protein product [Brassicogethes aeneus]|uniref:SNRNP25 ubiquitin-like domain-containing protein n=1 Tax=Brassicogethes aeneus TaxID=1431903 RepID=A0A9P0FBQ7_BRAAE|nr:unnamed protein product [Brassicogethes aeneus]
MIESSSVTNDFDSLTHEDLLEISQSSLKRLITTDTLLRDLPVDVTVEEVTSQIALLQGQSITVTVYRYSESSLNVVIPQQGATVLDLRRAIQRCYTLKQQRQRSKTKISWKYIWKTYYLQNVDTRQVLRDHKKYVSDYGVQNRSVVRFVKKLRKENPFENNV